MSPLSEKDLARTLRDQADRPDLNPIGLDEVKTTARGIQRRRRIGTGLAALAVVAGAAIPTALLLGNDGPRVDDPIDDPDVVQLEYGREVPLDLRDAVPGDGPATTGYLLDGETLHMRDLVIDDLGVAQSVVPFGDGWFVEGVEGGEIRGWLLDTEGQVLDSFLTEVPVHDATTGRTAYVVRPEGDASPELVLAEADGSELWRTEVPAAWVPRDIAGDEVAMEIVEGSTSGGDTLQLVGADGATGIGMLPEGVDDIDAATGWVTRQVDTLADNTGCFAVIDVATDRPVWERTCDYGLRDFSPDGRFLSAGPAYRSGMGDTSFAVLDATTGATVVDFIPPQGLQFVIIQSAWEDEDSLLISIEQSDGEGPAEYAVLRLDLDGTVELVSEILPWNDSPDWRITLLHPQARR